MTITVKVHVNGDYEATVIHKVDGEEQGDPIVVKGGEERTLNFRHDHANTFEITEEYVGQAMGNAEGEASEADEA